MLESISSSFSGGKLGAVLLNIGIVLAILVAGWIIAKVVRYLVFSLLKRSNLDNRLASVTGIDKLVRPNTNHAFERGMATVAYVIVLVLAVIAALEKSGLRAVAGPLENGLTGIISYLPAFLKAAIILLVSLIIAKIVRAFSLKAFDKIGLDSQLNKLAISADEKTAINPPPLAGTVSTRIDDPKRPSRILSTILFGVILFLGVTGAAHALNLPVISEPLQALVQRFANFLPNLIGAALILLIGYVIGFIVKNLLSSLFESVGLNTIPKKIRMESLFKKRNLGDTVGIVAMFFILIHALSAALGKLQLDAVQKPLTLVIDQFWSLLPKLGVAAIIIIVMVFIAKIVKSIIVGVLDNLSFDEHLSKLGIALPQVNDPKLAQKFAANRPSNVIGTIIGGLIIIFGLVQALDQIGLNRWASMVHSALEFVTTRGLVALCILAIGLILGNLVAKLVKPYEHLPSWTAGGLRIAILIFAFTMALQQLQVAQGFVLLTFGLVFGSFCLAMALAFGLGARDVAGDIVKKRYDMKK